MRKNRLQLFMPFLLIISFFFCLLTVAADVLRSQPQLHDSFDEFLRSSGSMENRAEDRVDDSDEGQPFGIQQQGGGRRGAEGGGGMRGMMAEEKPVPSAPGDERDKELRESPAAAIRGLDLENFCFGNGDAFPLGPCSSTFLKCGRFNAVRRFTFEECPLGNVFVGKECKPARKVRDCFLPDVNLLNDATEKLSQAVDFCARKEPFEPVLYFFDGPAPEDKCSRQALLCRGSAASPLAISCPSGKVLNVKTIGCVESPDQCAFVSGPAQTPIRQHLLQLLCREQHSQAGQQPFTAPMFPQSMQASKGKDRCRNWYFVCQASEEPELVFCDNGKMFDPAKRICRRILPEDQCPNLGACRGWEWRMSPVGECRPDFLFCNGMRPQLFQCERQGEVFKDGECTLASNACDVCQPGEMKRSTDKCEEFFLCERDTSASSAGRTRWRQFICTNGRLFHPQRRQCVQPTEFQCPTKTACQEGDSYSVECGDFFLCAQGRYVAGKCPDMTRWDAQERRCVFSAECRQFKQEQQPTAVGQPQQKCLDGQTRPSADCKHFEECLAGAWVSRRCQEYASDRLKDPCRFCSEPGAGQQKDFYPLERLLPDGFNPFDGQGVRQRRCVEGEKIVNRHDCARFMECVDGDWFNLACPGGHFFSPRTQGCVLASSANSSAVPMCQELIPAASGSPAGQSPAESVHLLPLYSANDSLTISGAIGPGAGPPPELGDQELRRNYEGVFQFCTAQSAQRIANPYDCTKYRECALAQGGYYAEKQCTVGAQFDPTQLACTYNYTCSPSNCVDSIREGLKDCGKAKECRQGQWQELVCPGEMAFVDGQCSQRIRCQSTNPVFHGQCLDGHTRPHASDCSKYLLCRYGQFLEENCNLGHRFNPKIGRCDPLYECPAKNRPPCYEGESRAMTAISATSSQQCQSEYELCRDGQYQRQNCPYGQQFAQSRCQAAANCQQQNSGGGGTASGSSSGGGTGGQQKCKESPGAAGFRADGQNCSKFYQCAQGNWVPKDCAKGTVFNPTLGVCDWPANVPGC